MADVKSRERVSWEFQNMSLSWRDSAFNRTVPWIRYDKITLFVLECIRNPLALAWIKIQLIWISGLGSLNYTHCFLSLNLIIMFYPQLIQGKHFSCKSVWGVLLAFIHYDLISQLCNEWWLSKFVNQFWWKIHEFSYWRTLFH